MIRATVFDLDGTLVQTERLKALSYARAAAELCPGSISEVEVLEAFKGIVGHPRREVARALMVRFGLAEQARARMEEFGASTPWQAFVQVRLRYYDAMLADQEVLRFNQWPHNLALLDQARQSGCKTALATMSRCEHAGRVLAALNLTDAFDFIATHDDVECGKPDPEIYQLVACELDVPAAECLVIEDSPSGVRAALGAGMWCIVVTTPFTRQAIRAEPPIAERWIVDDPTRLTAVVRQMVAERRLD